MSIRDALITELQVHHQRRQHRHDRAARAERRLLARRRRLPRLVPLDVDGHRASSSPIFTQGDQDDLAAGLTNVPDGRYLISVLADGYKLDGEHFTMPLADDAKVVVRMQPPPLPDATIQAAVFEDISPVNGAPDLPAEHGLAGFSGVVRDTLGEVTTDVYGAPLCGTGVCLSYCYVVDGGVDIGIVKPADAGGRCPTIPTTLAAGRSDRAVLHDRRAADGRQRLQPSRCQRPRRSRAR